MSKNLQDLSLSDATESKNKLTKMDAPEIDRYERRVWRRRRRHRRLLTLTALIIIVVGCLQEIADASGATVAATAAAKNNNNDKGKRVCMRIVTLLSTRRCDAMRCDAERKQTNVGATSGRASQRARTHMHTRACGRGGRPRPMFVLLDAPARFELHILARARLQI